MRLKNFEGMPAAPAEMIGLLAASASSSAAI